MGTTAKYAIPYPAGSDPPAGAPQMQALAEQVDASLSTVASTIQPGVQSFTQTQIDALTPGAEDERDDRLEARPAGGIRRGTGSHGSTSTAYRARPPPCASPRRPRRRPGQIIWNTDTSTAQIYNGTTWGRVPAAKTPTERRLGRLREADDSYDRERQCQQPDRLQHRHLSSRGRTALLLCR